MQLNNLTKKTTHTNVQTDKGKSIYPFHIRGRGQGRIQDFKLGGAHLKIFFGVFHVKNHDFTPKNRIFSNFMGRARRVPPTPWIRPWGHNKMVKIKDIIFQ